MIRKHPVCPDRIRTTPDKFSWIDHRLVRDHHIERLTHEAAALYLFLVTVGDYQGLSYYADHNLCRLLTMDEVVLNEARNGLLRAGLIAYQSPLYQVLGLDPVPRQKAGGREATSPMSLAQIFKKIAG